MGNKDFAKPFEFKEKESEFNAAMASLMRIDKILQDCNECSCAARMGSYPALKMWSAKLWAFYLELSSYLTSDKNDEIVTIMNGIFKQSSIIITKNTESGKRYYVDSKNVKNVIDSLTKTEHKLRTLATEKGMLIVMKDDGDSFDREW